MKRNILISILILSILLRLSYIYALFSFSPPKEYGVFLGIDHSEIDKLSPYHMVVIEPSEFTTSHIRSLHEKNKLVYGYINIGAIEKYRPYYSRFSHLTLDTYENWKDEKWMDVSQEEWQTFLIYELGKTYSEMGLDGFFLDNTDVYGNYPTSSMFQGLCTILKGLKAYRLPLILNGGDIFVTKCMEESIASDLFDGINQETVFTSIHFDTKTYGIQKLEDTRYLKAYLAKAKEHHLSVFLLEYGANAVTKKEIDSYCKKNGFLWYSAPSLSLQ